MALEHVRTWASAASAWGSQKIMSIALHVPTVPDGLARPFDAALQRRLTDELTGPHLRTQFLPRDHMVAMRQQIHEHLEYLGS